MRWPWISREHHEAVLQAKQELVRSYEAQIESMKLHLDRPIAVTVALPPDFAVLQPAVIQTRTPKPKDPLAEPPPPPINWDLLDENDPVVIARIAARELGGSANAYVLARKVESIKSQIRQARKKKLLESLQSASVGTIEAPPPPRTVEEAVKQGPQYVPAFIRTLIEEAEKV